MLNGCLTPEGGEEGSVDKTLDVEKKRQTIMIIKGVIAVLTVAMKFEPASAKHFVSEVSNWRIKSSKN